MQAPSSLMACACLWWAAHQGDHECPAHDAPLGAYLHAASPRPLLLLYGAAWMCQAQGAPSA